MVDRYMPKIILPGDARRTWDKLNRLYPGLTRPEAFQANPDCVPPVR